MKAQLTLKKVFVYAILIFMSILFIAPFFWMFTTAFKGTEELYLFPPKLIPSEWHFENFKNAWAMQPFNTYLVNTLLVVGLSTVGALTSCSLVAYGFARFQFKGREVLFMILLASMMIPWEVTMIPQYMEFNALGWINTLKSLIVPSFFGSAYFIFLLRQFFLTLPRELEESGKIDGANSLQIFTKLILPLTKPALALVAIMQVLNSWNDYLGPLIFLNNQDKYTLTLGLSQFKGLHGVDMTSIMAITAIISIPPLVIFFMGQKCIVEGIAMSGMKD